MFPQAIWINKKLSLLENFNSLVAPVYGDDVAESVLEKCLRLDSLESVAELFDGIVGTNQ